ncbi:M23 family metallopeptidase [Staphylococcus simiae]|uniref:lysostaphin n=1 Tax=Staphylococcus simiae CCM 7213 = CCUG 51256 TaxID=911238 RepID=G5JHZ6_9STAP|nr:M23 family metallopeptidase [Staphylococcus simiae]EHJ08189.1 M23/M37 peptidase domain protein [Staphylococcus simiae CCM 7213 = CCUG 51256]PNZ14279.1 M23 family peptidase [Staphylococcus simiae]SNV81738.1 Peptidase, M23/M37 family [Staphylococcus simiae]
MTNIENIFVQCIEENKYKYLYKNFSKEFREAISRKELKKVIYSYKSKEHKLFSSFINNDIKYCVFVSNKDSQGISITINKDNEIVGLYLGEFTPKNKDKSTKLKYYMPIDKIWTIIWGGNNKLLNYHNDVLSQQYAFDLVIAKKDKSYFNKGETNEDYYAYGENVLAPQKGIVVDTRSTMKDNKIGETDTDHPFGNYVIIRHDENEYSLIAHFKQHSILVSPGEKINESTILGKCGNSGNSSEPHIHFQVMDSSTIFNDCASLKIKFANLANHIQGQNIER